MKASQTETVIMLTCCALQSACYSPTGIVISFILAQFQGEVQTNLTAGTRKNALPTGRDDLECPPRVLWAFLAERLFLILGQRSVCGRSAVPFSREGRCEDGHLRGLKKGSEAPTGASELFYNNWITSGRSVLPPRPCGWPSWWRCAPRCGCRRTSPRSRTLPCLPAQPAGRFPAQGRSGSWENP